MRFFFKSISFEFYTTIMPAFFLVIGLMFEYEMPVYAVNCDLPHLCCEEKQI